MENTKSGIKRLPKIQTGPVRQLDCLPDNTLPITSITFKS